MTSESLKKMRLCLGMTQQEFADILKITKRQYQNYEWGYTPFPWFREFVLEEWMEKQKAKR